MRNYKTGLNCLAVYILIFLPTHMKAQENMGMATGNYAGIAGVWFNPASIADSRYKFDINIIGIDSYYNNNYLLAKHGLIVRRLLYKVPYNSSFSAVKNDLFKETPPINGKVFGRLESNIHFPLSFMVTTGKKSAIALTMNNRTVNLIDNMPVDLARAFYSELRDKFLYGKDIRTDSMQYNFLNWQEIGLTYSRVLVGGQHHFLKIGATLKWLGASAGGYIKTGNAVVNFKDSQTLSLRSPLIHYARSQNADIGQFTRRNILNNLEDQSFGWDAGLVYEFRARVKNFKYTDANLEEMNRRDLNKYMFRIGLSIVDMGKFTLKKKELTDDHSANILNWDFSGLKASNLSQWDTAYSRHVTYINGTSKTFSYRLPAALIANFDLHLMEGLYINVAAKAPFESFKKATDTYVAADKWVAVTPRFEGRFFALYVPVIRKDKTTNIGATVKIGPFYAGSNNLAELLTNTTSYEADFHAGARISILYGKPNQLSTYVQKILSGNSQKQLTVTQQRVDSLSREVNKLKTQLLDSALKRNVIVQIGNYGVSGTAEQRGDSVLIRNRPLSSGKNSQEENVLNQQNTQTDSLVKAFAQANLELAKLRDGEQRVNTDRNVKASKKEKNKTQKVAAEVHNKELEEEMERIRKQMVIQNTALIGGGVVAVAATTGKKEKGPGNPDSAAKKPAIGNSIHSDSAVIVPAVPVPTGILIIHDTIIVFKEEDAAFKTIEGLHFDPVLFANGSTAISATDTKRIQSLAINTQRHPQWRIELTGMTDAKGSVETNRRVAAARCAAVSKILLTNGVKDNQVIVRAKLADTNNLPANENPRRVAVRLLRSVKK